jgi:hypothetical protein
MSRLDDDDEGVSRPTDAATRSNDRRKGGAAATKLATICGAWKLFSPTAISALRRAFGSRPNRSSHS